MAQSGSQLAFDREFAAAAAAAAELGAGLPELPVGDVEGRRISLGNMIKQGASMIPPMPSVTETYHEISTPDGATITLTEFRPPGTGSSDTPEPAVYHCHGGGMILGSVTEMNSAIKMRVAAAGIRLFSIEYRLAPEYPHPIPINDCYAGLTWLHSHASGLGIDNGRIMVFGESAGGGLAAGLALKARDEKLNPPLAYQLLVYPMLDDRNLKPMSEIEPLAMWKCADNITGWEALLGKSAGSDSESTEGHIYAAPARAKSVAGLPPTYIDVGQLDIFGPEDIKYAARLMEAGVPVEFHLYPGLPHAFEGLGAQTSVVKGAMANRQRVFNEFKRGTAVATAKGQL